MQVTASDSLEFAAAVVAFLSVGVRSNNQLDPVSVVGVKSCVTQGCQKSCETYDNQHGSWAEFLSIFIFSCWRGGRVAASVAERG